MTVNQVMEIDNDGGVGSDDKFGDEETGNDDGLEAMVNLMTEWLRLAMTSNLVTEIGNYGHSGDGEIGNDHKSGTLRLALLRNN